MQISIDVDDIEIIICVKFRELMISRHHVVVGGRAPPTDPWPLTLDPWSGGSYQIRMRLSIGRLGHRMQMWRTPHEIKETVATTPRRHPPGPEGGAAAVHLLLTESGACAVAILIMTCCDPAHHNTWPKHLLHSVAISNYWNKSMKFN